MFRFNKKALARLSAAGFIASTVSLGLGTHALAGTNGQQLTLLTDIPLNSQSVFVQGTNQNGNGIGQCFNINGGSSTPPNISGWYWVGSTTIQFYQNSNCINYQNAATANVPQNYPQNYWAVNQP